MGMIDTQKLYLLLNDAQELPWSLATSNSWRRIVDARHGPVCTPCNQPDGHPDLSFADGLEGPNAELLIAAVNALPELLSALNAQTAEITRLRSALLSLLDALPSATTHPAIKAARAALAQEAS